MQADVLTYNVPPACVMCRSFRDEQWGIGYCQNHQVYVLSSYVCEKFAPADILTGDDNRESVHVEEVGPAQK